jgi:hypothetical protein
MKTCIWCNRNENYVTFNKKAHTFPKSLGGKSTCNNVCDDCNHYFGSSQNNLPAVEIVLKEILNISKYLLLNNLNEIPKNKRFKSEYFNLNLKNNTFGFKPRYKLYPRHQEIYGRLFCRGIYKVFLEERENQKKDASDPKFDFIREFSRFDLNENYIYLFKPKNRVVFFSLPFTIEPMIKFTPKSDGEEERFGIFEYMIMGHYFGIPTNKYFEKVYLNNYLEHLKEINHPFGTELIPISRVEDIDYIFRLLG